MKYFGFLLALPFAAATATSQPLDTLSIPAQPTENSPALLRRASEPGNPLLSALAAASGHHHAKRSLHQVPDVSSEDPCADDDDDDDRAAKSSKHPTGQISRAEPVQPWPPIYHPKHGHLTWPHRLRHPVYRHRPHRLHHAHLTPSLMAHSGSPMQADIDCDQAEPRPYYVGPTRAGLAKLRSHHKAPTQSPWFTYTSQSISLLASRLRQTWVSLKLF
ncbi:hypothetical protein H4R34_005704 [Dimargaris verticillata]|uniref:Uncharacterized protein n=1 Tax=Dimargaris verticillata TaxID=2761393 RepID=A0A9W8B031_9FUNG|nr:hypothetical protein H4R34_005704 [Dimargaris verticillata]